MKQMQHPVFLNRIALSTALACGALTAFQPAFAANYILTDLGTLGGNYSSATGLNEAGQVVGVARTAEGFDHGFIWQNSVMTDLGTLGGTNSHAAAINAAGQIVGWAETPDGRIRACLFGSETNSDLSGGHPDNSYAAAINEHGRVVGWTDTPVVGASEPRPTAVFFRASNPRVQLISLEYGTPISGRATAINSNFIAGWQGVAQILAPRRPVAAVWQLSNQALLGHLDGFPDSHVRGLNATGQLVGESGFDYVYQRAALWSGTNLLSLGSLALDDSSTASAINEHEQIVGSSVAYRFGLITNNFPEPRVYEGYIRTRHAFLWQNGVMTDLNDLIPPDSGWELTDAAAINDAGQLVGTGRFEGQTRAFLLTPASDTNQIPFIRLVSPADGEWVPASAVKLEAEASDSDGRIQKVEFFARRVARRPRMPMGDWINFGFGVIAGSGHPPGYLGTATNTPFTFTTTNLSAGNYLVLAKATDDRGVTACAAEVLVRVHAPPVLRMIRGRYVVTYPPPPPDGSLSLIISGTNEELSYDIEASDDLVRWTKLNWFVLPHPFPGPWYVWWGTMAAPTNAHLFYRAVARVPR